MGGGGKVPYPKHVWSPAGGWYANPSNWKGNTAIAGAVVFGIMTMVWGLSAEREQWSRPFGPREWAPSRRWSKQLIQYDKEREAAEGKKE